MLNQKFKTITPIIPDPQIGILNTIDHFDSFIAEERRNTNMWRMISFVLCIFVLGSLRAVYYAIKLPASVVHVVEESSWGETRWVGEVGEKAPDELSIIWTLKEFIRLYQSTSTDVNVIRNNYSTAYKFCTLNAGRMMNDYLKSQVPYDKGLGSRVEIVYKSVLKIYANSYQVDWEENIYSLDGRFLLNKRYRGMIEILFDERSEKNPSGIYIDDYRFTVLEGVE